MKLRIDEKETPNIEVKHEGILEVPEGKKVDELPYSHFEQLAKKKGLSKITKALNNLQVWNKNDDKELSKWAGNMIDKLNKKLKKDESLKKLKEDIDLSDYKYVFNKDGYKIYCKIDKVTNKGVWAAAKYDFKTGTIEEPFEISYEQARGFEPINPAIRGLQKRVSKALNWDKRLNSSQLTEDLYNIIYDIDSEDGYTYTEEETFKGSWTDLQNLIKQMKSNGCYNIDANAIYDEEDFEESLGLR